MSLRNRDAARTHPRNTYVDAQRHASGEPDKNPKRIDPKNLKSLRGINLNRINDTYDLANDASDEDENSDNEDITEVQAREQEKKRKEKEMETCMKIKEELIESFKDLLEHMTIGVCDGQSRKGKKALQEEVCRELLSQQKHMSLAEATSEAISNEPWAPQGAAQTVARAEARKLIKRNMQIMLNKYINKEHKERDKNEKRKRKQQQRNERRQRQKQENSSPASNTTTVTKNRAETTTTTTTTQNQIQDQQQPNAQRRQRINQDGNPA